MKYLTLPSLGALVVLSAGTTALAAQSGSRSEGPIHSEAAMKKWFERIGRAAMMGVGWAGAWVPVGALVGTIIVGELEPEHIGGSLYAGFLCGALFSAVAGIAAGRRTLASLSPPFAAVRGALSGLLGGGLWLLLVFGSNPSDPAQWLLFAAVVGSLTLASAISGVGSAWLARAVKKGASTNAA